MTGEVSGGRDPAGQKRGWVSAPLAEQMWLSSGLEPLDLMVCLVLQEHLFFQGRSSPKRTHGDGHGDDQEACPSLDRGSKPSTQWALNPVGTRLRESTSREGRTQRLPYPPVRDLGGAFQGAESTKKGVRPILPACT